MAFLPEDVDVFNADVRQWAKATLLQIRSEINAQGIVHRENSKSSVPAKEAIKANPGKKDGVTSKVSFKMPRHMVFVHKGVGRGTKISAVGTTGRKAKPWFNPVLEKNIPNLVDIVADHHGAMILNAVMIR